MSENLCNDIEKGIVKISDEVVAVIAGLAAEEVKGIVGMSAGIVGGFTEILSGKKNFSKGVRVNLGEEESTIDLFVVVEYGVKIHEVAKQVQENVKESVESMTGLVVSAVNVYVQNVMLPKKEEENIEE
ncbi:Asp23/Gls24 family envelope stress response protein [Hathewaya limosa]|uniref:Alkaline shock family protein YloU n=1 Tax=Hathewaya limosa TaxID=1536 RepID=A0ABU0JRV6_HATLI|nr:Asp23/Gls24 family envelope stress response protein [Hathewaya limosa]AWZ48264.1 Asp23/Gls24 family envelope stress response protein [Clostridiaceae bacterium 14S0207]MDQ0479803.1 putative alkaline shock family protein YloU [Hathewaya limosa]